MKFFKSVLVLAFTGIFLIGCQPKYGKSEIEIIFTPDTLNVGYTYWWPESGPFIGNCGEELSLVFTGIVKKIDATTDEAGPLYTSQNGIVEIDKIFKIKEIGQNTYANQKFFTSDCFNESGLKIGDRVLVVCYDYENDYSIPGGKSILKVASLDDPLITSIRKYIDADENPLDLKNDTGLWATYSLGRSLERIIACTNETEKANVVSETEGNE
ncbi:hypothetical protein JQC67_04280 [Aurantibacter crassamenti]|uniref:hypothetical protein n=1 Tax=Aurantibacter crassamenti TaxID=1837375 RepID=UPI0019399000|nr:hypothetical protein [Aurantibacter crassamenti]MBM1105353.1 hypothetical protein [Aurantibacter crassamenti]